MTSPTFKIPTGPQITPYSSTTRTGGAALPPYLQTRRPTSASGAMGAPAPTYSTQQTQPVVTPKSTAVPGEVATPVKQQIGTGTSVPNVPQAGGQNLADIYKFFKSDLLNQTNQALANARSDAAARGVFYGTPLTGSEADINTQYLRGLGQLQAGMYGNEQQNILARLGLASNLGWQSGMMAPPMPAQTDYFSQLGQLFGPPTPQFGQSPVVSNTRMGPSQPATPQGQLPSWVYPNLPNPY